MDSLSNVMDILDFCFCFDDELEGASILGMGDSLEMDRLTYCRLALGFGVIILMFSFSLRVDRLLLSIVYLCICCFIPLFLSII